jgi:thiamine-phosphate pyrophosphorylase
VLSDRHQARLGLVATLAAAVAGGARTVVLRERDLGRAERADLGCALVGLLAPVSGTVVVAGTDVDLATSIGARGLHLSATDPFPADRGGLVIGRSCHDVEDLRAADAAGADYATMSPVFASLSKPGYGPALGTVGLAAAARATTVPVVALGGITPANARSCLVSGAAGVAVMGTVMRADDPSAATAALLAALPGSCVSEWSAGRRADARMQRGQR